MVPEREVAGLRRLARPEQRERSDLPCRRRGRNTPVRSPSVRRSTAKRCFRPGRRTGRRLAFSERDAPGYVCPHPGLAVQRTGQSEDVIAPGYFTGPPSFTPVGNVVFIGPCSGCAAGYDGYEIHADGTAQTAISPPQWDCRGRVPLLGTHHRRAPDTRMDRAVLPGRPRPQRPHLLPRRLSEGGRVLPGRSRPSAWTTTSTTSTRPEDPNPRALFRASALSVQDARAVDRVLVAVDERQRPQAASMCHCRCAATRPLASRRWSDALASARSQSPCNRASSSVASPAGTPHRPGGRAGTPLPRRRRGTRCGPGAAQRAHSISAGSQPALAMARRKNASSTRSASRSRRPAPASRRPPAGTAEAPVRPPPRQPVGRLQMAQAAV